MRQDKGEDGGMCYLVHLAGLGSLLFFFVKAWDAGGIQKVCCLVSS
jgi:hypothetical protein